MPRFKVQATEEKIWIYRLEAETPEIALNTIKHLRLTSNPIPPTYTQDRIDVFDEGGLDIDWDDYKKEAAL